MDRSELTLLLLGAVGDDKGACGCDERRGGGGIIVFAVRNGGMAIVAACEMILEGALTVDRDIVGI